MDANQEVFAVATAIANAANEAELKLNPAFKNASDEVIELALNILDADRALSSVQKEALGLVPALEAAAEAAEEIKTQEEITAENKAEALRLARAMSSAQADVARAERDVANAAEDVRIANAEVAIAREKHAEAQADIARKVEEAEEAHAQAQQKSLTSRTAKRTSTNES